MSALNLGSNRVALMSPNSDRKITTAYSIENKRKLILIHLELRAWMITNGWSADRAGHLYAAVSTSDGIEVGEVHNVEAAARSIGVEPPVITMTLGQALSMGHRG